MKKIFATLITAILLLSTCIIAAFPTSAEDINWDDWIFDGNGELVAYYGSDTDVVIPAEDQDGVPTISIGTEAFVKNNDITSVTVPEGVVTIGRAAFEMCSNLEEVSLPSTLKEVKGQIFRFAAIKSIVIPAVKRIETDFIVVQDGGEPCTDIIITPGVEEIANFAFYADLKEIVLPKSVCLVEWGFYTPQAETECEVYVLNPQCVLGAVVGDVPANFASDLPNYATEGAPFIYNKWHRPSLKIRALEGSTAKTHVEKHLSTRNGIFVPITEDQATAKEVWCKENGVKKPGEKPQEDDKDTSGTTDTEDNIDNNNDDAKDTSDKKDTEGDSNILMIVIIIMGVVIILLIAAVLAIVIINNNKKKKKKAKKAAKAAEAAAPVEEPANEEKGEE